MLCSEDGITAFGSVVSVEGRGSRCGRAAVVCDVEKKKETRRFETIQVALVSSFVKQGAMEVHTPGTGHTCRSVDLLIYTTKTLRNTTNYRTAQHAHGARFAPHRSLHRVHCGLHRLTASRVAAEMGRVTLTGRAHRRPHRPG